MAIYCATIKITNQSRAFLCARVMEQKTMNNLSKRQYIVNYSTFKAHSYCKKTTPSGVVFEDVHIIYFLTTVFFLVVSFFAVFFAVTIFFGAFLATSLTTLTNLLLTSFPVKSLTILVEKFTYPPVSASKVSSPPFITFVPGWNLVPLWRIMILPAATF